MTTTPQNQPIQQGPTRPTIQTTGVAVRQLPPKSGRTSATITTKAPTRDEAWLEFQKTLTSLRAALAGLAEVGNSLPRESTEEVTKLLRTETEYILTDEIEITFEPGKIGELIKALVDNNVRFTTPTFMYDKLPKTSPELLGEAARVAKQNAVGLVAGIDARLGRLVAINVGPPQLKKIERNWSSFEPVWDSLNLSMTALHSATIDSWDFDLDQVTTYDTEVLVTVEFEVIEDNHIAEVA